MGAPIALPKADSMQFERISSSEVLVLAPVETAREAAWYALKHERIPAPMIDVASNLVSGSQGDGVLTPVLIATASFQSQKDGTLVSFESIPAVGATDLAARGRAKKLANTFERVLNSGGFASPDRAQMNAPAPIAAPSGGGNGSVALIGQPLYGPIVMPKLGMTLLCYSIFGTICCQIMAPITLFHGMGVLKQYHRRGDPGDRGIVVAAMMLSGVVTFVIVLGLLWLLL